MKNLATDQPITNDHGLLTYPDTTVGYIMDFEGKGMFDPDGKLEGVSKEMADEHNRLLDQALIEGLDKNCEIGQGYTFYRSGNQVTTFLGNKVADIHRETKTTFEFSRAGKTYRGYTQEDADCFNFKRIS